MIDEWKWCTYVCVCVCAIEKKKSVTAFTEARRYAVSVRIDQMGALFVQTGTHQNVIEGLKAFRMAHKIC